MILTDKITKIITNDRLRDDLKYELVHEELSKHNPGITFEQSKREADKFLQKLRLIKLKLETKASCYGILNLFINQWYSTNSAFAKWGMFKFAELGLDHIRAEDKSLGRQYTETYNEILKINQELSELGFDDDVPPDWETKRKSLQAMGMFSFVMFMSTMVFALWIGFKFMWWWNYQIW